MQIGSLSIALVPATGVVAVDCGSIFVSCEKAMQEYKAKAIRENFKSLLQIKEFFIKLEIRLFTMNTILLLIEKY